ncbi:hypothetical protein GGX14DRAFT_423535 [Mycena pura]|uniref:Bladder cancer-related BC10-like protein n=1 Tax=Mycena pura TaxID=153505 RepID=A0AAD7E378_9AGAR|nr:hypothetical protein GGX14DRAFT_423535 [Mycena pura]
MWCTRWFLPLLLLPLPTAPPYFLVLFLLALFIQAKPCFYCIVLLVALFFSSCYWQPFPTDTPLFSPWADNVTTFAEALNQSISLSYDKPLPPVVRALDRCWCDFWTGGFFEPYSVSQWEHSSILKLADELERARKVELAELEYRTPEKQVEGSATTAEIETMPRTSAPQPSAWHKSSVHSAAAKMWSVVIPYLRSVGSVAETTPLSKLDNVTASAPTGSLPALRWEYDLRPYGLGLIVDFAWTR